MIESYVTEIGGTMTKFFAWILSTARSNGHIDTLPDALLGR
ncbi:hypothetical protein AA0Y32_11960 [Georgenia phoenicis]